MALALESLTFSVETKELENAILKMKELGQAASSLNKPIEQLGKSANEAGKKVEQAALSSKKLEQANNKTASATDTLTAATTKAERSNTRQVSGVDKLQNLLNKLGNTYSDVSNGLTRGESNILNTARSYGALESQLEPVKQLLEQIKGLTKDPFDSAIGSVRRITQEFEALKQRADLANSGIFLTTKQLQEYSKIANEVKGKIISSGIKETDAAFLSKYNALLQATQEEYKQTAKNVNNWQAEEKLNNEELRRQEQALIKNATAMDDVAMRWKSMQAQHADKAAAEAIKEQNRLLEQGAVMMDVAVQKWKALQIAKQEKQANEAIKEQNRLLEQGAVMMDDAVSKFKAQSMAAQQQELNAALKEQNRLMQQNSTMMDSAVLAFRQQQASAIEQVVKSEQDLIKQEQKLQFVTQKTAEGFTVASANALYRYELALKKAGVTEQEFISRSNAYSTALKARQDVSDTNKQRSQATQELIRIEQQLADQEKFISFATAEFAKQQNNATKESGAFSDMLSMQLLRQLFAFEQGLRRTGVAEEEVIRQSADLRQRLIGMQQATEGFNGAVNHLGRNVGVQFTDIFVSLYNGQPVMQVITQQGGQLADAFLLAGVRAGDMSKHLVDGFKKILESYKMLFAAFGGLAAAGFNKILDTFVVSTDGLRLVFDKTIPATERLELAISELNKMAVVTARSIAAFTAVTGAILAIEFYKSAKAADTLVSTMVQYGGAIGGSLVGTQDFVNELQKAGWSAGQATEYITAVAKAGNLSSDQMKELAGVAKELDTWLNVNFEDTVKLHSEIKKAPLETIVKMAKETGLVSAAVVENISQYEQAGNKQAAVLTAMNEAIRVHGDKVTLAKQNYSDFAVFIIGLGESIKKAYNNIFSYIWEKASPEKALAADIKSLEDRLANPNLFDKLDVGGELRKQREEALSLAKQEYAVLKSKREQEEKSAEYNRRNAINIETNSTLQKSLLADLNKLDSHDAKRLSQQEYINAAIAEQVRLSGEGVLNEKTLGLIRQKAITDWKKAREQSGAKPSTASTAFNTNTGNELKTIKEDYNRQLQAEQDFQRDALATMQSYYKAGYSTSTEYFAQQQDLIIKSRQQQLQILDNYNKEELAAFDEKQKQLEANALQAKQRGANPDDVNKKLAVAQANLARERANFVSMISGKEEQVWSESIKLAAKELDEITKSTAEFNKTVDDYNKQLDKQASERNLQLELQQQSIGLSEQEKAVFEAKTRATIQHTEAIQKMQKEIESAEQYALDLVNAFAELGQPVPFDVSMAMFDRILQAKQAKEKANVKGIAEVEQQAIAANTLYQIKEYEKLNAALSDAISTALFEGGEQGKKKLRDIIVAELSKPITLQINAFVNSVLSDVIGKPNNDSYVQNTTSSILDTIGVLNSAYKLVNNSISSSITKGFTSFATSDIGIKMGLGTSNVSAVGPVKPSLTSTGTAVNSALTMAGNAYAGYGLQKSISGGYVTGEKGIVDAATVIASAISGPIAGVVGGTVNRAFGRKLKDQGLEGTFGGADGFDGNSYEFYKGGWFRSDKTKRKALDSGVEDALETQFKALQTQTAMMAQTLGLGVDSVVNFTSKIKVSFKGLSEEQINERMAEEFGKVAESMTSAALGTTEYTRTGETAVETLTRLSSSLTTVNGTFDVLGKTLYASTLAGADMASQLVDLMGGIEQFTATSASYLENFYTEAERTADATRQLTDALASVGVDAMPATRDAYRDLVESQDLTTESGRETYAALMGLNGAFAALVPSADDLASALAETQTAIKDVFQELRDAIQGARDDVQSALYTISGPKAPRDFAKLTTAVSAVDVTAPSSQSVTTAKSALEQARNKPQYLSGAESYAEYWANLQAGTQAAFESAQQRATQTQGAVDARWQDVWNWSGGDRGSWQNYRDQINAGTWWEYDSNFSRAYRMSFKDWYNETTRLQGVANEAGLARTNAISANDSALAKKSEAQTSANTANAEWQSSITAAQDALTAAENDYLSSITGWVSTAKVSVETLGALKDETLAYYEAQQQLADGMRQSAANLRSSAQEAMRQTLSTDKALELRLADFDRAYTLALSTSGADKAGYADQMAAALPQLAQDIAAKSSSREDWQLAVAKLASKSSTVAAQLEAQAPVNLQAEANRVLGLIDGKLADLNTASVSAEQVIATAVNAGAARTAAGLQEVVKALTGETASASFAVGGYTGPGGKYEAAGVVHRGEVVFSQDDIARLGGVDVVEGLRTGEIPMFSNGGIVSSTGSAQTINTTTVDNTELVTELKSLREEVKMLRAEARATAMNTSKTARILDDTTQGGTELRVTAIQ